MHTETRRKIARVRPPGRVVAASPPPPTMPLGGGAVLRLSRTRCDTGFVSFSGSRGDCGAPRTSRSLRQISRAVPGRLTWRVGAGRRGGGGLQDGGGGGGGERSATATVQRVTAPPQSDPRPTDAVSETRERRQRDGTDRGHGMRVHATFCHAVWKSEGCVCCCHLELEKRRRKGRLEEKWERNCSDTCTG